MRDVILIVHSVLDLKIPNAFNALKEGSKVMKDIAFVLEIMLLEMLMNVFVLLHYLLMQKGIVSIMRTYVELMK